MRVKPLLLGFMVLLLNAGTTYAADIECHDVISVAEIDYPPDVPVTVASSSGPERFCRFSVNGYVADSKAQAIKNTIAPFLKAYQNLIYSGKLTGDMMIKALPYLLFTADKEVDLKLVAETGTALEKGRSGFTKCYDDFLSKKNVEAFGTKFERITLQCSSGEKTDKVQTKLSVSDLPVTRVTFISR